MAEFPDIERVVVDVLTDQLDGHDPAVTVGVGVPEGWTPASPAHVTVRLDADPVVMGWPVCLVGQVRLVARTDSPTAAKQLAGRALALLKTGPRPDGLARVVPLTGPLSEREPETGAEIAAVTARVTVRAIPA